MQGKIPLPLLLFAVASLAQADTLKLKTGEVIEGKVISASPEAVTIEVQFSPTIMETKIIPTAEIAGMERAAPDEIAFAKIAGNQVPETILFISTLDSARKPFQDFIRQFSYSQRVVDAKERLAEMDAEVVRINAGDIKLNGRWIDQKEYAAEKYQIEASIFAHELQQQVAARNPGGALNAFADLRAKYPNSVAYVDSLPFARQAILDIEGRLAFEIRNLPIKLEARRKTVEHTRLSDQARVEKALADEDAQLKATATAAKTGTRRFFAINSIDEEGLIQMQAAAKEVRTSLANVKDATLQAGAKAVALAKEHLASGDLAAAQAAISDLDAKWPQYEGSARLKATLAAKQKTAALAPTPGPIEEPTSATTPPATPNPSPADKTLGI